MELSPFTERLLSQLLLGTIWDLFYFCCCCFPQMYNKSTVIKASCWKPIRFFNYVPRKLQFYQHIFHLGLKSRLSSHSHISTYNWHKLQQRFFPGLACQRTAVWHSLPHEHSVKILILTYRQVISMKHRTLREGDSDLTALDRLISSRIFLTFSCCSRLSVSISSIFPSGHSIYPSTFATWQIHKCTWLTSDIPCRLTAEIYPFIFLIILRSTNCSIS